MPDIYCRERVGPVPSGGVHAGLGESIYFLLENVFCLDLQLKINKYLQPKPWNNPIFSKEESILKIRKGN